MLEPSTETLYEPEDPLSGSVVHLSDSSLSAEFLNTSPLAVGSPSQSLPPVVSVSQSLPPVVSVSQSLPATVSQALFPVSHGLPSNVDGSPKDVSNLPDINITEQVEINTDVISEYDKGLNSDETFYQSEGSVVQDSAMEIEGTRDGNSSTSLFNHYMKANVGNEESDSLHLIEDNSDYFIDNNSERCCHEYEQSVNFGNIGDSTSVMFGSTKVTSDESPNFLLQVCQATLPEEVENHLKQVKVENDNTTCLDSLNSTDRDPYISNFKCTPDMSASIEPEHKNVSGSAHTMLDLSPYVAVLDWNNNNIDLPEKLCDNEDEEVEIYIFDGADGADTGIDVESFLQASENVREYVPVDKGLVTSGDELNVIDSYVLQGDVEYGGSDMFTCKTGEIPDVKVEMNVDCDDFNVSSQSNDEGDLVDMKYVRNVRDIKHEVCFEDSEAAFSPNLCNSRTMLPVFSTSGMSELCPGQYQHSDRISTCTNNSEYNTAYYMDSLERKDVALFSKNEDGVVPCLNDTSRQETNSVNASVSDSCSEFKHPGSLLKSLNSLVESKRKAKKRKGKELCVKLSDNLVERDIMLKRLKTGKFGKRPHVVRITQNGVLLDVTREYMVHLPCRIRH